MGTFFNKLKKVQEVFCVILLIVMVTIIFLATVGRYTGLFSIAWSEELARYCMIWMVFIGVGIAALEGTNFVVDAMTLWLSEGAMKILHVVSAVITLAFALFAGYYGLDMIGYQYVSGQVSATLHMPMWIMYISMPLGLVNMGLLQCWRVYLECTGKLDEKAGEEEKA